MLPRTVPNRLTGRQDEFCRAYVIDFNAKQAAITAGYSPAAAEVQGSQLLSLPKVKERIAQLLKPKRMEMEATRERTIQELARIAYQDVRELYDEHGRLRPIHELDDHVAATIAEVTEERRLEGRGEDAEVVFTKKVKSYDKLRALEALAKYLSLYSDAAAPVINVNTQVNTAITVEDLRGLSDHERTLLRQLAEARSGRPDSAPDDAGPSASGREP